MDATTGLPGTPATEAPLGVGPLPPTGDGRRFVRHAFVCASGDSCAQDGGAELHARLKGLLKESGRKETLRVNKAGCLGQCGHGPNLVVYPEGVWYSHVDPGQAQRIWDEHLVGGQPVEELRYRTAAGGTNVVGRVAEAGRPADMGPRSSPCARCPE